MLKVCVHIISLKTHMQKNLGITFLCALCPKEFKVKQFCNQHQKRHNRQKLYECTDCKQSFIIPATTFKESHEKNWCLLWTKPLWMQLVQKVFFFTTFEETYEKSWWLLRCVLLLFSLQSLLGFQLMQKYCSISLLVKPFTIKNL